MKSVLNVNVSSYAHKRETTPKEVDLMDWLRDETNIKKSEKVRDSTNDTTRKKLKLQLPCVTPSGIFSGTHSAENLKKHSGIVCIDIDLKHNLNVANFKDLKNLITKIDCVAYCAYSTSGQGFFVLIPILRPDQHEQQYKSLAVDFARCGIKIDSTSDVCRLRFATWDKDPYRNDYAKPYSKMIIPVQQAAKVEISAKGKERVEELIKLIDMLDVDITGDYPQWVNIGFALANTFGEVGREMYHKISRFHPLYENGTISTDEQYNNCLNSKSTKNPISINTLFDYAKEHNVYLNKPGHEFADN